MIMVSIRELTHNFSSYLKEVKAGEHITIMDRNTPVADIVPHNPNVSQPSWKAPRKKFKIPGVNVANEVIKERRQSR